MDDDEDEEDFIFERNERQSCLLNEMNIARTGIFRLHWAESLNKAQ
jgi:hypothetical protein